jgi:hypothetical protein
MKKLRRNKPQMEGSNKTTSGVDTWLTRFSHLSQLGLLAVAVFGYFYTVVPIYEKSKLDEEIARKELELAATKAELEVNYSQLRKDLVGGYIFYAGAKCSGLLDRPTLPPKAGEKRVSIREHIAEVFDIEITSCLRQHFEERKSLTKLRPSDYTFLSERLRVISESLERKNLAHKREFIDYPSKVKDNPNLLPPLDTDSFSGRTLEFLKKRLSPMAYQQREYNHRVEQGLREISEAYIKDIQNELKDLIEIEWPKNPP